MDKDKTISRVKRRMALDVSRNTDFSAYDDMDAVRWTPPVQLENWERVQVSTAPHDALKTAYNIFDTNNPKWEILPRGRADADNAEEMERWLEWNMARANTHGDEEPFREILHHSSKYNYITAQLDYLPYWLPKNREKWTKEQKLSMRGGPFCIIVHHPGTVYYEYSKYALRWVARVVNVQASDVIDHWSAYSSDTDNGKTVSNAIKKLEKMLEEDEEARVVLMDYTDYENRRVYCFPATGELVRDTALDAKESITVLDTSNKLGFINWVIVKGNSDALLYSLHKGAIWENQNLIDTLLVSNTLKRGYFPLFKHQKGGSGKELDIDYAGVEPTIELEPGEDAEQLQPPPMDPGFLQLSNNNQGAMALSTGIRYLQNVEAKGNIEFATLNAFVQLAMTQLEPYTRNAEKALAELGKMAFLWIKETKDVVPAYRTKTSAKNRQAGARIVMEPDRFDPEDLFITCELIPNTPTDKMQLVNMFATLKNAGAQIPWSEVIERLSFGFPEPLRERWQDEQVQLLALELFSEKMKGQVGLELQQIQGQLQMSLQQEAMANQPQGQPVQGQSQGQGFDTAQGGSSGAEMAPQMTQTAARQAQGEPL